MSEIEEFILDLERAEDASDMKFSVYYIPPYYQPEEAES